MKLSKFTAAVKRGGYCKIYRVEDGDMWLGTETAIFRAPNLPEVRGREQLRTVLDLNPKQMEKVHVEETDCDAITDIAGLDLADVQGGLDTEQVKVAAVWESVVFSALRCYDGELIFYDKSLLAPLADEMKSGYTELRVRTSKAGQRYIVIKDGFIVLGAVMPVKVVSDNFLEALNDFMIECKLQKQREDDRKVIPGETREETALDAEGMA